MTKCEERLHALVLSARADWKCFASTPASARCAQVIVGPFAPYTLTNWALVGRPASANRRVPSAILARAALLRITDEFAAGAAFVAGFVFFAGFAATLIPFELFIAFLD